MTRRGSGSNAEASRRRGDQGSCDRPTRWVIPTRCGARSPDWGSLREGRHACATDGITRHDETCVWCSMAWRRGGRHSGDAVACTAGLRDTGKSRDAGVPGRGSSRVGVRRDPAELTRDGGRPLGGLRGEVYSVSCCGKAPATGA